MTALFADLARSTALGERLDPEVVRGLVGSFFDLARREVERRGGNVEKFSGDAVMAVFGLPQAHEDDPERAVRAAVAIRDGLAPIAAEAGTRHGVTLLARIGIESGEVVVGDPFGGATMAEGFLREAADIIGQTDYTRYEEETALAEFLLRCGRATEAEEWLARARQSVRRFGPESPLIEWVERRASAAVAAGG